jgi:hypothetical protein
MLHGLHKHMHSGVELESNLNPNSNRKNETCKLPSSTGCNFPIRDRNSAFHPPLERLQNYLGFWYSRFPQISFESGLKAQIVPDSSVCPELTPSPTFSDHNS